MPPAKPVFEDDKGARAAGARYFALDKTGAV
jgi:hypothetical protein